MRTMLSEPEYIMYHNQIAGLTGVYGQCSHSHVLKHGYIMYCITKNSTPVTLVLMVKNRFYTGNCIHANVLHVRTLWYIKPNQIKSNQILDTMVYQIKSNSFWFHCSSILLVIVKLATAVQLIKSHTYYIISYITLCKPGPI